MRSVDRDKGRTLRHDAAAIGQGVRRQRCAIYTRVSTEHGLDMEFNSLDAQREACEAYITSQKHEGWQCLAGQYNDGGFSGGSLDRPDLQRLMTDIKANRLDIIVVYKVDRLTRSLADFAKLVELFDTHGVSFVSVTQSFNTTTSMGRLTLNVLLSFAQFEREVTGERIRDKISASKKKGIRMGGPTPLGYGLKDKKLVIDEVEAKTVRQIFAGYLEHGSLTALMRHLDCEGIVTKRTVRKDGSTRGGVRFGKGALAYVLRNRVYRGEISHRGQHFPAEHEPIVAQDMFDAVQEALARSGETKIKRRLNAKDAFLLADRIVDDRGNRMTPTVARKNGAHYRHYVSSALAQGRHQEAGSIARVSALEVEAIVAKALSEEMAGSPRRETGDADPSSRDGQDQASLNMRERFSAIDRVIVSKNKLEVRFSTTEGEVQDAALTIPWTPTTQRRLSATFVPDQQRVPRPISSETRARLLIAIAKARHWQDDLVTGRAADTKAIAEREGCSERSVRHNLNLAFLSPTLVKSALDGTLPKGAGLTTLVDAPMDWAEQASGAQPVSEVPDLISSDLGVHLTKAVQIRR
jgi:DNA invertase Pin-like site-specific DNA recombinase